MKRILAAALIGVASLAHAQSASAPVSPAKKALVDKLLQLQQPGIEVFARNLLQMPAMRMMQEAGLALQRQVAPDKREAVGKQIEAEMKKFMDESVPLVRASRPVSTRCACGSSCADLSRRRAGKA